MSAARLLAVYRLVFGTLIVVSSVQTLLAVRTRPSVALAAVEIAGAILLMWRRTQWLGAPLLFVVFAWAQVISAAEGDYPTRFLQYAASTLLIVLLDRTLPPARRT